MAHQQTHIVAHTTSMSHLCYIVVMVSFQWISWSWKSTVCVCPLWSRCWRRTPLCRFAHVNAERRTLSASQATMHIRMLTCLSTECVPTRNRARLCEKQKWTKRAVKKKLAHAFAPFMANRLHCTELDIEAREVNNSNEIPFRQRIFSHFRLRTKINLINLFRFSTKIDEPNAHYFFFESHKANQVE